LPAIEKRFKAFELSAGAVAALYKSFGVLRLGDLAGDNGPRVTKLPERHQLSHEH
jgi:hypothetical protein